MADISSELGVNELTAGAGLLSRPAEEFVNDQTIEELWAIKAYEHSEVYFNILCSVDTKHLRLTPHDNEIYQAFRESFPDLEVEVIKEDEMKSNAVKEKWRTFISKFSELIKDYNFGTLIRIDSKSEYSEKNSTLVTRLQFYAIELARNREGFNDDIRTKFKATNKST